VKLPPSTNKLILIERISNFYLQTCKNTIINKKLSWNTITYNKMDIHNFSFTNNLPHFSCDLPTSVKYGSFVGRLHSFSITNLLRFEDFLNTSFKLIEKLTSKNLYNYYILQTKLFNFI
jgi:hypothetical protein